MCVLCTVCINACERVKVVCMLKTCCVCVERTASPTTLFFRVSNVLLVCDSLI